MTSSNPTLLWARERCEHAREVKQLWSDMTVFDSCESFAQSFRMRADLLTDFGNKVVAAKTAPTPAQQQPML